MIRPASEIQYPPSEAQCTKARMIARMERLSGSTDGLMKVIAERLHAQDADYVEEIESLTAEQDQLIENMRKILQS